MQPCSAHLLFKVIRRQATARRSKLAQAWSAGCREDRKGELESVLMQYSEKPNWRATWRKAGGLRAKKVVFPSDAGFLPNSLGRDSWAFLAAAQLCSSPSLTEQEGSSNPWGTEVATCFSREAARSLLPSLRFVLHQHLQVWRA